MKYLNRFAYTILGICLLNGCSKDIPADPMCRVQPSEKPLSPAPAVCLIKLNSKLLAITTHQQELWSLPVEKQHKAKSAQCSAHQAVWKSTGLNVEVGELLFTDEKNVHYFSCIAQNPLTKDQIQLPVPTWATSKVNNIQLINPYQTQAEDWSPRHDLLKLREAFTQL
ncbi:hypothetical protein L0668_18135 [Paraglaciecola aquimarina]|uniref:Uncharacterized protein n=1 Tax=Paraglaciecola algarum TaxID=3050085 RepID=A0ABS9DBE8_9ALTE|nr:hypothetical protein [Paraglaciecola sp. G1-23]MCF2950044.1 hypothetical protein [Paraglaciecola sp. G1-23]